VKLFSSKHLAVNSDPSLNRLQFLKKAGTLALSASTLAFLASCVGNNSQTSDDPANPAIPGNPGGTNPGGALNPIQLELNYMQQYPGTYILMASGSEISVNNYNDLWLQWVMGSSLNATQKLNLLDKLTYLPQAFNKIRNDNAYNQLPSFQTYHELNFVSVYNDLHLNGYVPTQIVEYREKKPQGILNTLTETGLSNILVPLKFNSAPYKVALHLLNSTEISSQGFRAKANLEDFQ
jgi:hypothetical protein